MPARWCQDSVRVQSEGWFGVPTRGTPTCGGVQRGTASLAGVWGYPPARASGESRGAPPSGRRYGGCASIHSFSFLSPFLPGRGPGGWSKPPTRNPQLVAIMWITATIVSTGGGGYVDTESCCNANALRLAPVTAHRPAAMPAPMSERAGGRDRRSRGRLVAHGANISPVQ